MTSLNHHYKINSASKGHFLGCVLYMGASYIREFSVCSYECCILVLYYLFFCFFFSEFQEWKGEHVLFDIDDMEVGETL